MFASGQGGCWFVELSLSPFNPSFLFLILIYRNIAALLNQLFELTRLDKNYHVRYTYTAMGPEVTLLEYLEWVDKGNLKEPFTPDIMQNLKSVLEETE